MVCCFEFFSNDIENEYIFVAANSKDQSNCIVRALGCSNRKVESCKNGAVVQKNVFIQNAAFIEFGKNNGLIVQREISKLFAFENSPGGENWLLLIQSREPEVAKNLSLLAKSIEIETFFSKRFAWPSSQRVVFFCDCW